MKQLTIKPLHPFWGRRSHLTSGANGILNDRVLLTRNGWQEVTKDACVWQQRYSLFTPGILQNTTYVTRKCPVRSGFQVEVRTSLSAEARSCARSILAISCQKFDYRG